MKSNMYRNNLYSIPEPKDEIIRLIGETQLSQNIIGNLNKIVEIYTVNIFIDIMVQLWFLLNNYTNNCIV